MTATETTTGAAMFAFERADDIGYVRIDQPERSVNAFSRGALDELETLLDRLEQESGLRGVLIRSGKPGSFIAGADIGEMESSSEPEKAQALSRRGQQLFARLARLKPPTVALISGACLGGGLEFALACRYRLADEGRKTLLGLPEVKLGLVPGWGGTVRLPERVGLLGAVRMITTGAMLNGRQARSRGLVDDVVPTEALESAGRMLLDRPPRRRKRSRFQRWVVESRLGTKWLLDKSEKMVHSKSHGHYPAPIEALGVLRAGLLGSPEEGFEAESAAIGRLAGHPVTRELIRLFLLTEEAKRWASEATGGGAERSVQTAGVLGAGVMGAGIAQLMAERGIDVRLKDVAADALGRGLKTAHDLFAGAVKRRRSTPREAERGFARIRPTTEFHGFRHADIVIEAIVEDLEIKRQVFRELETACAPTTALATNTSSLRVADLATAVKAPERVVGVHFFNPPARMKLVEVIRTEQTSPEALAAALGLVKALGKTPIVVGDCPGFLVNRLLAAYLNEAGYLLERLPDPLELDRAAIAFGFPIGPLRLTDLVGLDVAEKVGLVMHEAYGARMDPAPAWRLLHETRDLLGSPSTLFERDWRRKWRLHPDARSLFARARDAHVPSEAPDRDEIIRRMVYPLINEAARCLEEGVVERTEQIDLAMVLGTGFAPFRGGPMRYATEIGYATVVHALDHLATEHPRFTPCPRLRELAGQG